MFLGHYTVSFVQALASEATLCVGRGKHLIVPATNFATRRRALTEQDPSSLFVLSQATLAPSIPRLTLSP